MHVKGTNLTSFYCRYYVFKNVTKHASQLQDNWTILRTFCGFQHISGQFIKFQIFQDDVQVWIHCYLSSSS